MDDVRSRYFSRHLSQRVRSCRRSNVRVDDVLTVVCSLVSNHLVESLITLSHVHSPSVTTCTVASTLTGAEVVRGNDVNDVGEDDVGGG
jgi:hypothetical protein